MENELKASKKVRRLVKRLLNPYQEMTTWTRLEWESKGDFKSIQAQLRRPDD